MFVKPTRIICSSAKKRNAKRGTADDHKNFTISYVGAGFPRPASKGTGEGTSPLQNFVNSNFPYENARLRLNRNTFGATSPRTFA